MVPMRDGVRLAADIYLPAADDGGPAGGPCPALLISHVLGQIERGVGRGSGLLPAPGATRSSSRTCAHGSSRKATDAITTRRTRGKARTATTRSSGFAAQPVVQRPRSARSAVPTAGSSQTVMALHRPPHLGAQWVEQAPTNIYAHEAREGGAMALHMAAAIHNHALDAQELRDNLRWRAPRHRDVSQHGRVARQHAGGNAARPALRTPRASKRRYSTTTSAVSTTSGGRTKTTIRSPTSTAMPTCP